MTHPIKLSTSIVAGSLLGVIALTTLFFGGTLPVYSLLLPALLSLAALAVIWQLKAYPNYTSPFILGVMLPLALVWIWSALQMVPASTFSHPSYNLVSPAPWPSISLNAVDSLQIFAYAGSLFFLGLSAHAIASQGSISSLLVRGVALVGIATAIYGLIVYISGNQNVLWLPKSAYPESLTSTFISRNHYATFAGLTLLASMAVFLERIGEISSRLTKSERLKALWHMLVLPRWPWLLGAAIIFLSLILTGSRAGIACTGIGLSIMVIALAVARPAVRVPLLAALAVAFCVALLFTSLAGQTLGTRSITLETDGHARLSIFTFAHKAALQHPWVGQGLGSFSSAFSSTLADPSARTISGKIDHAHNTYLELAVELGLPAVALLAVALAMVVVLLLQGISTRRQGVIWPALGLGALCLVCFHALADFSLSIPAVTITTLILVCVGLAQSRPARKDDETVPPNPLLLKALILPLAPLLAFSVWNTWAYLPAMKAAPVLRQINQGQSPQTDVLKAARSHVEKSLERQPYNPSFHEQLGRLDLQLAEKTSHSSVKQVLLANAGLHIYQSLQFKPQNSDNWFRLARIHALRGNLGKARAMLENSLSTALYEQALAIRRLPLMLELYPTQPPQSAQAQAIVVDNLWNTPGLRWSVWGTVRQRPQQQKILREILSLHPERNAESWQKTTWSPLLQP